jgi:RNA polymerase sigma factor (sigma-70 family)
MGAYRTYAYLCSYRAMTDTTSVIRLLLVEGFTSYRDALSQVLENESDMTVIAEAGSIEAARSVVTGVEIDVALIDDSLPDGSGLNVISTLLETNPQAIPIVLTSDGGEKLRSQAVAAGAAGVLSKRVSLSTICSAIRDACEGKALIPRAEAMELLHLASLHQQQDEEELQALDQLSPREADVLRLLAAGLDNAAISAQLNISQETVRSHVVRILRKLGANTRLQAVVLAIRQGFIDADKLL